jgi:hypothetical protein
VIGKADTLIFVKPMFTFKKGEESRGKPRRLG